jgi:hypothetical protein
MGAKKEQNELKLKKIFVLDVSIVFDNVTLKVIKPELIIE